MSAECSPPGMQFSRLSGRTLGGRTASPPCHRPVKAAEPLWF